MVNNEEKLEMKAFRMTYDEKIEGIYQRLMDIEKKLREHNIRIGDNESQILNMKHISTDCEVKKR